MGISLALASMLCFAVNIFIVRSAMTRAPVALGFLIVLATNVLFAGLIFAVQLALRKTAFEIHWGGAGLFALSGFIGVYLGRRMMLEAIQVLGPARASVLHSASPVFTLIGAWVLVGERLGPYELALMVLVMLGLWAVQPAADRRAPALTPEVLKRAATISMATVLYFGFGNAIRGAAMRSWDEAVFGAMLGGATALAFQLLTSRDWQATAKAMRKADRRGLALYTVSGVATVTGTMFGSISMNYIEIAIATLIGYTTPLVAFPVSVFILRNREMLNLRTAAGAVMVLTGIALLALR